MLYKPAKLEYYLALYDEAERSIARAFELEHADDGSMWLRLARIFVRRYAAGSSSDAKRYLGKALEAFGEALKFRRVDSKPMHFLEVTNRTSPLWMEQPNNRAWEQLPDGEL